MAAKRKTQPAKKKPDALGFDSFFGPEEPQKVSVNGRDFFIHDLGGNDHIRLLDIRREKPAENLSDEEKAAFYENHQKKIHAFLVCRGVRDENGALCFDKMGLEKVMQMKSSILLGLSGMVFERSGLMGGAVRDAEKN